MKIQFALGMAIGLALGATAVHALHAQTRPPIYYVAEVDVTDPEAYIKEFVPKAATSAEAYGGRILAASSKVTAVEGTPPENRVVVMRWEACNSSGFGASRPATRRLAKSALSMQHQCGHSLLRACLK
jgi:hypothetical protein